MHGTLKWQVTDEGVYVGNCSFQAEANLRLGPPPYTILDTLYIFICNVFFVIF